MHEIRKSNESLHKRLDQMEMEWREEKQARSQTDDKQSKDLEELEKRVSILEKRLETGLGVSGEDVHGYDNKEGGEEKVEPGTAEMGKQVQQTRELTGQMEKRMERLERQQNRLELIIRGLEEDDEEDDKVTEEKVGTLLQDSLGVTDIGIVKAYRLGRKREGVRPVKMRCSSEKHRQEIWKNKNKLKGTKVYIHEELTWKEREHRRKIMVEVRRLREEGRTPWLKGSEVIMDDKTYVWDEGSQGLVVVNKAFLGRREWRRTRQRTQEETQEPRNTTGEGENHRNRRTGLSTEEREEGGRRRKVGEELVESRKCRSFGLRHGEEQREIDREIDLGDDEGSRIQMLSWNIAGIMNADSKTGEFLERFDVIGLQETWAQEHNHEKLLKKVEARFHWFYDPAIKEKKKGRAKGGVLMGIRKSEEVRVMEKWVKKNMITVKLGIQGETVFVTTIYINQEERRMLEELEVISDLTKEDKWMIMGDFNARIGEVQTWRGRRMVEEATEWEQGTQRRKSKDKTVNKEGKLLLTWTSTEGLSILNGSTEGDREGDYTYIGGRGMSVIDYCICNERMEEGIADMRVGEKMKSDHLPLEVYTTMSIKGADKERAEARRKGRYRWDEEGKRRFKDRLRPEGGPEEEDMNVEEKWERLKERINEAKKVDERKGRKPSQRQGWWCKELKEEKKVLKGLLKRLKKCERKEEQKLGETYRKGKKNFRRNCKVKKEEHQREIVKEAMEEKDGKKLWKIINSYKGERNKCQMKDMEAWKNHFMTLLDGEEIERAVQGKVVGGGRARVAKEDDITKEEVVKAIRSLRKEKSAGIDDIEGEVWIYAEKECIDSLWEIIKDLWSGEKMPDDWKRAIITPIYKKGDKTQPGNYRGIAILCTAYKVYAKVLKERLMTEVERKKLLPDWQAGFRSGRSTMDNVYIMQKAIDQRLERKAGKLYTFYADLKSAYDKVNRIKLWEKLEKMDIGRELIQALKNIYKETTNVIRVEGVRSEEFVTRKGLRQGCPLSSLLFILLINDIEEVLKGRQDGGVVVKGVKVLVLAYADDVVLMAEEKKGLQSLIHGFKVYLKKRDLWLNIEKSKVQIFRKGGRRAREEKWWWGEEEIEVVTEFCYLGYMFSSTGTQRRHIQFIAKKARAKLGQIWSVGERLFRNNFTLRTRLFDAIVKPMMLYGAEIWGWAKWVEIERVQNRYFKWVLKAPRNVPEYLWRTETSIESMWPSGLRRAWRFESKARKGKNLILQKIVRTSDRQRMESVGGGRGSQCVQELKKIGLDWRWLIEKEEGGESSEGEIMRRMEDIDKQERIGKINKSAFARHYKEILPKSGRAKYLDKMEMSGRNKELLFKYRSGYGLASGKSWVREGGSCRVCQKEVETLQHVLEECSSARKGQREGKRYKKIVDEEGEGVEELMEIDNGRKETERCQ